MGTRAAAFAVLLLSGSGSTAVLAASEDQQATPDKPVREERVVCTRETITGSHFKRKVCRTESQMQRDRTNARLEMEQMRAYQDAEMRRQAANQNR
jgi:predicted secreted protein